MAHVKFSLIAFLLLAFYGVCRADSSAVAEDPQLELKAHQVFDNVMSPFCPGKTLNDCPSSEAAKLKSKLKDELIRGVQPEAVINELVAQYGEELRAAPSNEGFGRLAWLGPLIFLGLGAVGLLIWLKRNLEGRPPARPEE